MLFNSVTKNLHTYRVKYVSLANWSLSWLYASLHRLARGSLCGDIIQNHNCKQAIKLNYGI